MFTKHTRLSASALPLRTTVIALALGLGAGLAAAADEPSVQIYGIVDIGVLTQSKSGTSGRLTQVATSGYRQSVWGFRGKEDLGNGLKVFFNLETHFDVDTGEFHGTGDAAGSGPILFRRQANLGLSGDWGQVAFGRQYGPALLAHLATEPRAFKEQFSNIYLFAYNQYAATLGPAPAGINGNNDVGIFLKNAIQYRNAFGPVQVGLAYALGETAGSLKKNSVVAAGVTYTGPVVLSFSYQNMKDGTTGEPVVKHIGFGGAVPVGDFTLKANYLNVKNADPSGAEVSDVDGLSFGVDYDWSPKNKLTVAYYDNEDKRNRSDAARSLVISNDYSLSKRTLLYVQGAYVDAKAGATIKTTIVAAGVPAQDARTTLLNVGINHNF